MNCQNVTVTVTAPISLWARKIIHGHGNVFDYRRHTEVDTYGGRGGGPAVLGACRCPGGHGVAGLPLLVWLRAAELTLALDWTVDASTHSAPPSDVTTEPELSPTDRVPTQRSAHATPALVRPSVRPNVLAGPPAASC